MWTMWTPGVATTSMCFPSVLFVFLLCVPGNSTSSCKSVPRESSGLRTISMMVMIIVFLPRLCTSSRRCSTQQRRRMHMSRQGQDSCLICFADVSNCVGKQDAKFCQSQPLLSVLSRLIKSAGASVDAERSFTQSTNGFSSLDTRKELKTEASQSRAPHC